MELLLEGDGVRSRRWAAAGGRWSDVWEGGLLLEGDGVRSGSEVWEVGCCWREME